MKNPFIAGNWVRGNDFFGRDELVNEILNGNRDYLWIAGTRRFGKTSLLKQLEFLTSEGEYADRFISLFWDMQGSQNLSGLKESLLESVEDAEERFEDIGVKIEELEEMDVFGILRQLRRKAREHNLKLLLLCDEAEELINIEKNNPEALPKLRRILQRGENIKTVLTATKRLSLLETSTVPETSPFLYGFVPPIYLTRLTDEQSRRLIALGKFDQATEDEIIEKANNHPYLTQLICRRHFETADLHKVIEEISVDDMIGHFFSVDFQYLEPQEREILLHLLQNENLTLGDLQKQFDESPDQIVRLLYELTQLGFVNQDGKRYHISNYFFRKWLEREKEKLFTESSLRRAEPSVAPSAPPRTTSALPEEGGTLGHHEILKKLGAGGMGIVYQGRDTHLNRLVALKVLLPDLMTDPEFKERFLLEARAASTMNHPNIATIYQIGEENGIHFISMEFVEGKLLKVWRKDNRLDLKAQIDVAIQAAAGLEHAHKKGVIHRDVKSDNIMVTAEGTVKIMDFGLAKTLARADLNLTKTGTTLGTLAYMSPEQASGLDTDSRADIFSLGIVLYELFTGHLPFTGDYELSVLYAIMNEEPKLMREHNPDLPVELDDIVKCAIQKDKEKRHQSMADLAADLRKVSG